MKYYVLASGSSGNSTLIESNGRLILVDFGVYFSDLEEKLERLGFKYEDIKAFLVTHEHIDHTRSLKYVDINYVYASSNTCNLKDENVLEVFNEYEINGFKVFVIPTSHDAVNSIGFVIKDENETLVYVTDTGYVHSKTMPYLKNADHYIFESNHDVKMLMKSNRPQFLKKRILSDVGHLSNTDSALLLSSLIGDKTKTITLAHLSDVANTPELALYTLNEVCNEQGVSLEGINIQAARRYDITWGDEYVK